MDITDLVRSNPVQAGDVKALIAAVRPELGACADPLREHVGGLPDGSVAVTVDFMATGTTVTANDVLEVRGRPDVVAAIEPCLHRTLAHRSTAVEDHGSYRRRVVVHLCISDVRPERPESSLATRSM